MKKGITFVLFLLLASSLMSCGQRVKEENKSVATDKKLSDQLIPASQTKATPIAIPLFDVDTSKLNINDSWCKISKPLDNDIHPITPVLITSPAVTEESPPSINDTTKIDPSNSKYAYKNWVKSTYPRYGSENESPSTNIKIQFAQDMNPKSLNEKTIRIMEGKHSSYISNLYKFYYNAKTRILNITFKTSDNSIGSGNGWEITITKNVMNTKNKKLGVDLYFGFMGQ